jgi:hypothetical protein
MEPTSPKARDLRRDARYVMHCAVEDGGGGGGEFLIRGHAEEVFEEERRGVAFEQAEAIGYNPKERYVLFELGAEEAASTKYEGGEAKRVRWRAVGV